MSPKDEFPPLAVGQRWVYAYQGRWDGPTPPSVWTVVRFNEDATLRLRPDSDRFNEFDMPLDVWYGDALMWHPEGWVSQEIRLDNPAKVVVCFLRRKGDGDA